MVRLGIIGTGRIAVRFVSDAWQKQGFELTAVYNPHIESAEKFVRDYVCGRIATDDWEKFLTSVDAVYVAAPHNSHFEYVKNLITAKKHVLCEKPMTLKEAQTKELYKSAKQNQVVLMEALKTAYCPGFLALMDEIHSGKIGLIKEVETCFTRLTPTNLREWTDLECGGSFTEFGSYVMYPVMKLLGTEFQKVSFHVSRGANGIDQYTRAFFDYGDVCASCKTGIGVKSEGQMIISGTKGYIVVHAPWWLTQKYEVRYEDPNRIETYEFPYEGSGLQYECRAFNEHILALQECSNSEDMDAFWHNALAVTPQESITMAGVMEQFLEQEKPIRQNEKVPVKIWAHRGCSMQYPENTLEAFRAAAETPGTVGIELDVQLTKDNEVVVFHDENVARVTDGDRRIVDYTLAELKELWIAPGDEKQSRIPTLREVLECLASYCRKQGLLINIELKTGVIHYQGIEEKTYALVQEYGLGSYIVYSSFWAESCKKMKEIDPANQTGMLAGNLSDCIIQGRYAGVDALHPYIGGLDCIIPEDMKDMPVRAWNCEEPFYKDGRVLREHHLEKYAMFGVTEVFTNVPEEYGRKESGREGI